MLILSMHCCRLIVVVRDCEIFRAHLLVEGIDRGKFVMVVIVSEGEMDLIVLWKWEIYTHGPALEVKVRKRQNWIVSEQPPVLAGERFGDYKCPP